MSQLPNNRPPPAFLILGNPENRRVTQFQHAVNKLGLPSPKVVSWLDAIRSDVNWSSLITPSTILRIESPGENFEVERELLKVGAELEDEEENFTRISRDQLMNLTDDHGLIRSTRQWYLGFREVLRHLSQEWAECKLKRYTHSVENIFVMFDKVACHAQLKNAGITVPPSLGRITSFDELQYRMTQNGVDRVFIKLAHGSSASGVIAYERAKDRQQAFSSVELVDDGMCGVRLYNSLKVRRYTRVHEIAQIVDALAPERIHVEAWIPKASMLGGSFDIRVLVIGSRARHVVVRQSRSPMTNLHLGNRRGNLDEVRARMTPDNWREAMETCERTMQLFKGSTYAGIDLLIGAGFSRHAVLEVNAFGDLLPNLYHEGEDTYGAQVSALLNARFGEPALL